LTRLKGEKASVELVVIKVQTVTAIIPSLSCARP